MSFQFTDEMVPLKLPQFHCRDSGLYFLLSTKPHVVFDDSDYRLWNAIDGVKTVKELSETTDDASARLKRFVERGICEMAESSFSSVRKSILVLEPHMDDAVLSVGGIMWNRRHECEFTVASIVGHSNFTSYYYRNKEFFDTQTISTLRKAESEVAMRMLGGKHLTLDELEAPLRYQSGNWSLAWYQQHQKSVAAFSLHAASEEDTELWAKSVEQLIASSNAEEIWLPLGVGYHQDHELARNACLRAVTRIPSGARKSIWLYEDVPYAARMPGHSARILDAIERAGGDLERHVEDISGSMEGKLRLVAAFGSQFKSSYMEPVVREAAQIAGGGHEGCCEVMYRLRATPQAIDEFSAYSSRDAVLGLIEQLRLWKKKHGAARRIRILSPIGIGNWRRDIGTVLKFFPDASFDIYVSANCLSETERFTSPRVNINAVATSKKSWLLTIGKVALSWPRPLIFLSGEKSASKFVALLRRLLFLSDPLVSPRMNHLAIACERLSSEIRR